MRKHFNSFILEKGFANLEVATYVSKLYDKVYKIRDYLKT